ncbi:MAG: nitrilase-related carbon-nitrogen hydrolase, partial [Phycisphaerae bacterium]
MSKIVRCGLSQCSNTINDESRPVAEIQKAMVDKHIPMIEEAGKKGVQILCLQEIFNGPYFCPSQSTRWYEAAEEVPGPTTNLIASVAKKYNMVVIVPVYEREMSGVLYNTAAVYDADGTYLGKYR